MHNSILIIFLIGVTFCKAYSQTMNDSLQNSSLLIAQNRNGEAIAILNVLIEQKKVKNDALMYRSQAYYQSGEYDNAFGDAKAMLKDNENLTEYQLYNANWNAGVSLIMQGKFAESLDFISNAQKLKKTDLKVNQTLALVYMNLNRFNDSMKYIKKCQKIIPNHFGNYKLLGQVYLMKGEYDNALINYDKSISLNPNYGPAYENRATVKLKLNDKDGACNDLRKALSLGLTHLISIIDEICNR